MVALVTESVRLRLGERLFSKLSSSIFILRRKVHKSFLWCLTSQRDQRRLLSASKLGFDRLIPSPLLVYPALSYSFLLTSLCLNNLPKKWKALVWGLLLLILLYLLSDK